MEKEYWLPMNDGTDVYVKKWSNPNQQPKAIIQLAHGMAEHINRYNDFAAYLVENGFYVYGNDHRGHGKTGERQGLLGYFAKQDGFAKTVEDLFTITESIKEEFPNTPIFLFGHSMGSFLARYYIQHHSESIDGVILSGTGFIPTVTTKVGKAIAAGLPPTKESKLMNAIAFGNYNKKIKNSRTAFDWLSNDEDNVQAYINDPHAGFVPTARFFYDLMTGLGYIHNNKQNKSIRHDLPMLLISGDADPVGNYAKGIWKTTNVYEKAGLENVTTMLFKDGRHELLNELNKGEVYEAILMWLEKYLQTP